MNTKNKILHLSFSMIFPMLVIVSVILLFGSVGAYRAYAADTSPSNIVGLEDFKNGLINDKPGINEIQSTHSKDVDTAAITDGVIFEDAFNAEVQSQKFEGYAINAQSPVLEAKMVTDGGTSSGNIWPGEELTYTVAVAASEAPLQKLNIAPDIPQGATVTGIVDQYITGSGFSSLNQSSLYKNLTTPQVVINDDGTLDIDLSYLPEDSTLVIKYTVQMPLHPENDELITTSTEISANNITLGSVTNATYLITPWDTTTPVFVITDEITDDELNQLVQKINDAGYGIETVVHDNGTATFNVMVPYDMPVLDAVDAITALDSHIAIATPNMILSSFEEETPDFYDGLNLEDLLKGGMSGDKTELTPDDDNWSNIDDLDEVDGILDEDDNDKIDVGGPDRVDEADSSNDEMATSTTPNDPYANNSSNGSTKGNQYYLWSAKFTDAWKTRTADKGVSISVIDTGCYISHKDLSGNIKMTYDGTKGTTIGTSHSDDGAHGTLCNGVIGAVANNKEGIAGAAYNPNLVPIKAGRDGDTSKSSITSYGVYNGLQRLIYLIDTGVLTDLHVISMSFGAQCTDVDAENANTISYYENYIKPLFNELRQRGVLPIAAAGNSSTSAKCYPAALDNVMAVMALKADGTYASFTNYGSWCDIATYGVNIWTTNNTGSYEAASGTSLACPVVAAAAGLLFSAYPKASVKEVENAIYNSATTISSKVGGKSWGAGNLNVYAALSYLSSHHTSAGWSVPAINVSLHRQITTASGEAILKGDYVEPGTILYITVKLVIQNRSVFDFVFEDETPGLVVNRNNLGFSYGQCQLHAATADPTLMGDEYSPSAYPEVYLIRSQTNSSEYTGVQIQIENNRGLAVGSVLSFTYKATVPVGSEGKTFTSVQRLTGKTAPSLKSNDIQLVNNDFYVKVKGNAAQGVLSLTKNSGKPQNSELAVGDTIDYELVLLARENPVTNVSLKDFVPNGMSLVGSISGSGYGNNASGSGQLRASVNTVNGELIVSIPDGMATGSRVILNYMCRVEDGPSNEILRNTVHAVGGMNSDVTTQAAYDVIRKEPPGKFTVKKINDAYSNVNVGDTVTYTVTGSVNGGPIKNITFNDRVPNNLLIKDVQGSATGSTVDGGVININPTVNDRIISIDPVSVKDGSVITLTYQCVVQSGASNQMLTNTATFAGDDVQSVGDTSTIVVNEYDPNKGLTNELETYVGAEQQDKMKVALGDSVIFIMKGYFGQLQADDKPATLTVSAEYPEVFDVSKAQFQVNKGGVIDADLVSSFWSSGTADNEWKTTHSKNLVTFNLINAYTATDVEYIFLMRVPLKNSFSSTEMPINSTGDYYAEIVPSFFLITDSGVRQSIESNPAQVIFESTDPGWSDKQYEDNTTVTKTVEGMMDRTMVVPGIPIPYQILVEVGDLDLADLAITDTLPSGMYLEENDSVHVKLSLPAGVENETKKVMFDVSTSRIELEYLNVPAHATLSMTYNAKIRDNVANKSQQANNVIVDTMTTTNKSNRFVATFTVFADVAEDTSTNSNGMSNRNIVIDRNANDNKNYNTPVSRNTTNSGVNKNTSTVVNGNTNKNTTNQTNRNINTNVNSNTSNNTNNGGGTVSNRNTTITNRNTNTGNTNNTPATNKNSSITNKNTSNNTNSGSGTNPVVNKNTSIPNSNKNTSTTNTNKPVSNTNNGGGSNGDSANTNTASPHKTLPFTDVRKGDWFYDAVDWSYNQGLQNGYAGTTLFGPGDSLTRAQAAVILWRYFEPTTSASYVESAARNKTPFVDNLNGKYYTEAMNWAYNKGLITGYAGTNLMGPDNPLTREQMCTIIYRCSTTMCGISDKYSTAKYNSFPDKAQVDSWASTAFAWAVDRSVINGWDGKYLAPTGIIDRAQMAQVMKNAVSNGVIVK